MLGQVSGSTSNCTFLFNDWVLHNMKYFVTNKYKDFIFRGIILFSKISSLGQAETVFYKIILMK